ncbi:hypothetical protein Tco_1532692 [Tanacetum coccineum]
MDSKKKNKVGEAAELIVVMWYELGEVNSGRYIYINNISTFQKHEHRHIHSFVSHIQSSKIHFRNSDKSKNFLKTSKLLIKTKVLHEEDYKLSRKYEYVGQNLQKINQDGFTVKNDDMVRSQSKDKKENGKIKIKISKA